LHILVQYHRFVEACVTRREGQPPQTGHTPHGQFQHLHRDPYLATAEPAVKAQALGVAAPRDDVTATIENDGVIPVVVFQIQYQFFAEASQVGVYFEAVVQEKEATVGLRLV
jgi:hypothetical protein